MQEQQLPAKERFDPKDEEILLQELLGNKKAMFSILQKSPAVGAYTQQTKSQWDQFYAFYINFLKSELGPRGDCAKKVRAQLLKEEPKVNKLLAPFKMNAATHIRQIYMKIKSFVPCAQFTQLKKVEDARSKMIVNIERFDDEESPMVKAISEGLIKKHGPQYDIKSQLSKLKENYIVKLKEANQNKSTLEAILDKCEDYHHLVEADNYLTPYFQAWKTADSDMGKENLKTGQLFEQKVFGKILPYLVFREENIPNWHYQKHKVVVFTNLSWIPKNLGEIDIALGFKDQQENRYFITTLIECKSRLFDVREAHKQVSLLNQGDINKGPTFDELKLNKKNKIRAQNEKREEKEKIHAQNKAKKEHKQEEERGNHEQQLISKEKMEQVEQKRDKTGQKKENKKVEEKRQPVVEQKKKVEQAVGVLLQKKFLSTKEGPAELVPNHHFYIITTLPNNQFLLPIQSKMKEGIQKFTKNMFLEDIQSQPLYLSLRERFQDVLSPLDWLKQYQAQYQPSESNIIVLK